MSHKILVIEDFEPLRNMYAAVLSRFEYTVSCADNGKDGYIRALDSIPDVIILDIDLPQMSGIDVLSKLRKHKIMDSTRVMIVTGEPNIENDRIAKTADLILMKPIGPADIIKYVRQLLTVGV